MFSFHLLFKTLDSLCAFLRGCNFDEPYNDVNNSTKMMPSNLLEIERQRRDIEVWKGKERQLEERLGIEKNGLLMHKQAHEDHRQKRHKKQRPMIAEPHFQQVYTNDHLLDASEILSNGNLKESSVDPQGDSTNEKVEESLIDFDDNLQNESALDNNLHNENTVDDNNLQNASPQVGILQNASLEDVRESRQDFIFDDSQDTYDVEDTVEDERMEELENLREDESKDDYLLQDDTNDNALIDDQQYDNDNSAMEDYSAIEDTRTPSPYDHRNDIIRDIYEARLREREVKQQRGEDEEEQVEEEGSTGSEASEIEDSRDRIVREIEEEKLRELEIQAKYRGSGQLVNESSDEFDKLTLRESIEPRQRIAMEINDLKQRELELRNKINSKSVINVRNTHSSPRQRIQEEINVQQQREAELRRDETGVMEELIEASSHTEQHTTPVAAMSYEELLDYTPENSEEEEHDYRSSLDPRGKIMQEIDELQTRERVLRERTQQQIKQRKLEQLKQQKLQRQREEEIKQREDEERERAKQEKMQAHEEQEKLKQKHMSESRKKIREEIKELQNREEELQKRYTEIQRRKLEVNNLLEDETLFNEFVNNSVVVAQSNKSTELDAEIESEKDTARTNSTNREKILKKPVESRPDSAGSVQKGNKNTKTDSVQDYPSVNGSADEMKYSESRPVLPYNLPHNQFTGDLKQDNYEFLPPTLRKQPRNTGFDNKNQEPKDPQRPHSRTSSLNSRRRQQKSTDYEEYYIEPSYVEEQYSEPSNYQHLRENDDYTDSYTTNLPQQGGNRVKSIAQKSKGAHSKGIMSRDVHGDNKARMQQPPQQQAPTIATPSVHPLALHYEQQVEQQRQRELEIAREVQFKREEKMRALQERQEEERMLREQQEALSAKREQIMRERAQLKKKQQGLDALWTAKLPLVTIDDNSDADDTDLLDGAYEETPTQEEEDVTKIPDVLPSTIMLSKKIMKWERRIKRKTEKQ